MTGNGASLSKIGQPDIGVMTLTEMVENAKHIQQTVDVPLISDVDNGFENSIHIIRTVREFTSVGVAAIHIKQAFPKRCGFVEGIRVISKAEAVGKIRAAVDTRDEYNPEMIIIARTDARGVPDGTIEDAINRVTAYCNAGADVAFIQGPADVSNIEYITESVDKPLLYNCSEGSPVLSLDRAEALGIDSAMFSRMLTLPTITTLFDRFEKL